MLKRRLYFPAVLLLLLSPCLLHAETVLKVSLMLSSGEQRVFFNQVARHFERRHEAVSVEVHAFSDRQYKENIRRWLEEERFDVMYWQAGERLFEFSRQGYISPIDELWEENQWDSAFPQPTRHLVHDQGHYYAVPYSYYPWGLYYHLPLFRRLDLEPPETWEEFLSVGEQLKAEGITPLSLGTQSYWPAAAWFDFINLRLNGPDFHKALLAGEVPYTDERVRAVFEHWRELIERDFFMHGHENRSWKNALPLLYRERAGMMLIGNFAAYEIPERIRIQMGLFSFPIMDERQPRVEQTPTDVFFLPAHASDHQLAKEFLTFLAEPQIQQVLNNESGMLPPNQRAVPGVGLLLEESQRLIDRAEVTTQYFDRDTRQPMAEQAIRIFRAFLLEPDIDATLNELEQARQEVF